MPYVDDKNSSGLPPTSIRDTLFGDMPFAYWAERGQGEPWSIFALAKAALDNGNAKECVRLLSEIAGHPGLEPRQYLQAWHFLRQQGVAPAAEKAKLLYGVVVEVALKGGLDLVAAYTDCSARYYNYSGAGIVWEHPDDSLNASIQQLLDSGRAVVAKIGPWEKPRPDAPSQGHIRINLLTPSGLHFGQGPLNALASDSLGGPVIQAAMSLMQALIAKHESLRREK